MLIGCTGKGRNLGAPIRVVVITTPSKLAIMILSDDALLQTKDNYMIPNDQNSKLWADNVDKIVELRGWQKLRTFSTKSCAN